LKVSELKAVLTELHRVVAAASKVQEMRRDDAARKFWHEIYPKLSVEGGRTPGVGDRSSGSASFALIDGLGAG
jgi:hypothetical protein